MRISDWSSDVSSSDLPNVTIGSDIYDMSQKGGSVTNVTVRGQSHPNVTDSPMTRVGYARVSTIDQDLDIPVARLKAAGREIQIGRASCRERVCQYVSISVVAVELKKKNKKKTI